MIFVHLQAFSRGGFASVDAVTKRTLACLRNNVDVVDISYSLMRLENHVSYMVRHYICRMDLLARGRYVEIPIPISD